jgi:flagellar protein FliT
MHYTRQSVPTPAHPLNSMLESAMPESATPVLNQYRLIATLSSNMLAQAQQREWNTVAQLGEEYQQAVEALKTLSPLSNEDREARRSLLTQILDNDARIRHLVSPELERLNSLLGTLKRQQNVLQAYSSPILNQ